MHGRRNQISMLTILSDGVLALATQSLERLKSKIRKATRRNRGVKFEKIISELNIILRGWLNYYQLARMKKKCADIDGWIRRKLRCYRIKQCKNVFTLKRFMKNKEIFLKNLFVFIKKFLYLCGMLKNNNICDTSRFQKKKWK